MYFRDMERVLQLKIMTVGCRCPFLQELPVPGLGRGRRQCLNGTGEINGKSIFGRLVS